MGSTNKTTNLQLPQWIGTDKPTFLGDMNDAFLKIDNGYSEIQDSATTAESQSGQAVSKATEALSKADTAQQTAETAQNTANTASQTANTASQTANNAMIGVNKINTDNDWVNVPISMGTPSGTALSSQFVSCSYNKGLNLLTLIVNCNSAGNIAFQNNVVAKATLPFTLPSPRTIYGGATRNYGAASGDIPFIDFTINTNGNISISTGNIGNALNINVTLNTSSWGI